MADNSAKGEEDCVLGGVFQCRDFESVKKQTGSLDEDGGAWSRAGMRV